ncbi:tRNA (carboxymethyluridine(34)-5-O)-methyltransferase [Yarrowia sp. B02]|nr:tRNA (carboxymethyluridine(34)-5-O)-methyltransferase [Yarrowia sp. B02]
MVVESVPSKERFTAARPQDNEQQHVHEVYNQIASHFSNTRYKPWPIVEQFLNGQPDYSVGVDVGCGNGKYMGVNKKLFVVGSDRSDELAKLAHELDTSREVIVCDAIENAHPKGRFDFAISIAVIHHFSTPERRREATRAILETLRPKGRALIYVWALEQKTSRRGWHEGMDQDVMVPWVKKVDGVEEVKYRYYHLYREGEVTGDVEAVGGRVVETGYEKDNWWVVAERNDDEA